MAGTLLSNNARMAAFGWMVLALVFVDELLAIAALGLWGWESSPRWVLVWLLPLVAMVAWGLFASPKAPYGGRGVRPVVKVLVFGLACLALWDLDRQGWAVALLVFSVVVNALAQIPSIRALPRDR
jgi:hypothetical protein